VPSVVRVVVVALAASAAGCGSAEVTPPRPLTHDQLAGTYNLTSIAWVAAEPFRPLPTWTWPGRVLTLKGSLDLSADGRYLDSVRFRTTLFGDTTFTDAAGTGFWTLSGDTVWLQPADLRNPPQPARLSSRLLTTYAGGFQSGGARFRYSKR